jgi:hypothetical protein
MYHFTILSFHHSHFFTIYFSFLLSCIFLVFLCYSPQFYFVFLSYFIYFSSFFLFILILLSSQHPILPPSISIFIVAPFFFISFNLCTLISFSSFPSLLPSSCSFLFSFVHSLHFTPLFLPLVHPYPTLLLLLFTSFISPCLHSFPILLPLLLKPSFVVSYKIFFVEIF